MSRLKKIMRSYRFLLTTVLLLATQFIAQAAPPITSATEPPALPPLGHEWQGKDYVTTLNLVVSGKIPLPHVTDPESAPIFDRLTDPHNFSFHRDHSVPARIRVNDLMDLQESWNALFKRYVKEAVAGNPVNVELARGQAFGVRILATQVVVLDDLIKTYPRDEKYSSRVKSFDSTYAGIAKAVDLAERSLAERFYSATDRSVLIQALRDTLPEIKPKLSDAFRAELLHRFEVYALPKQGEDERNLTAIIDALRV